MKILKFPAHELFKKCKKVSVFGTELKVLLDAMFETMVEAKGIGLAANQVGLNFNMFVMVTGPENERLYLVNPKIIKKSVLPANLKEGCLSAPGELLTLTERASWVHVSYQDETGKEKEDVFFDIRAVCVQHEIDHLSGISFLSSKSIHRTKRKDLAKKWGLK